MAYSDLSQSLDRRIVRFVEIDLDYCSNTFGSAPCTATGTGDSKCYNTYFTCKDKINFNKVSKTYRFCEPTENVNVDAYPCLRSVSLSPSKIGLGEPLAYNSSVRITLQDFPHHDRGTDPYVNDRSYNPSERGTFFPKLKARNRYYLWRNLRVLEGYATDDGIDWDNFKTYNFLIDKISDPDPNNKIEIVGRDLFRKLKDATVPKAYNYALAGGVPPGKLNSSQLDEIMAVTDYSQNYRKRNLELIFDKLYIPYDDSFLNTIVTSLERIKPNNSTSSEGAVRYAIKILVENYIAENTVIQIDQSSATTGDQYILVYNNGIDSSILETHMENSHNALHIFDSSGGENDLDVSSGIRIRYNETEEISYILPVSNVFPANERIRFLIGEEVIEGTTRTDQLSFDNITRGVGGSEISEHDADSKLQKCYWVDNQNIKDVVEDILLNYAGFSESILAFDDDEIDTWMSNYTVSGTITEPENITNILKELSETYLFDLWWSDGLQKVVMKPVAPLFALTPDAIINDDSHLLRDSIKSEQNFIETITRFSISYDLLNITEYQDSEDFRKKRVVIDAEAETAFFYDRESYKNVLTRFNSDDIIFEEVASRWLQRFNEGKTTIEFELDPSSGYNLYTGDIVYIETYALLDVSGAKLPVIGRITERTHISNNGRIKYKTVVDPFYWVNARFIAPDGIADWADPTGDNEKLYGFISDADGYFDANNEGHVMI